MKSYILVNDQLPYLLSGVQRKHGVPIAGHVENGGWYMRIVEDQVMGAEVKYREGEDQFDTSAGTPYLTGKTFALSNLKLGSVRTITEVLVPDSVKGNYQDLILWAREQPATVRRLNGVDQLTLHAVPETTGPRPVLLDGPEPWKHYGLTDVSFPVFTAPVDLYLEEVVAICLRDEHGRPVHGALLATAGDEVVGLRLVDEARGIDVCADPSWIALGLNAAMAKIRVQSGEKVRELPWSIIDMRVDNTAEDLLGPTEVRRAAWSTYIQKLAPAELLCQAETESPAL